jgi:hypothetical protein
VVVVLYSTPKTKQISLDRRVSPVVLLVLGARAGARGSLSLPSSRRRCPSPLISSTPIDPAGTSPRSIRVHVVDPAHGRGLGPGAPRAARDVHDRSTSADLLTTQAPHTAAPRCSTGSPSRSRMTTLRAGPRARLDAASRPRCVRTLARPPESCGSGDAPASRHGYTCSVMHQ